MALAMVRFLAFRVRIRGVYPASSFREGLE